MLRPLRRSTDRPGRRLRRGVYLLPSMFTVGNMFCGYACIVHAMRGEFQIAAPFIGFAMVLDMLDGRIARMTGTSSDFGLELDSLADVISFGMAPAILSFSWGLQPLGRLGWAVGFLFVAAAALRLARFNIQAGSVDKRYFVGMPSPAAAAGPAATVFAYPYGFTTYTDAVPVIALGLGGQGPTMQADRARLGGGESQGQRRRSGQRRAAALDGDRQRGRGADDGQVPAAVVAVRVDGALAIVFVALGGEAGGAAAREDDEGALVGTLGKVLLGQVQRRRGAGAVQQRWLLPGGRQDDRLAPGKAAAGEKLIPIAARG